MLPIQIFNWISQSREEFHDLAAAAIVVLLADPAADELRRHLPPQPYQKRW